MATKVSAVLAYDAVDFVSDHRLIALWCGAICAWISFCLIVRVWGVHRRTGVAKKVLWSVALLFPFLGWLFYAAFFQVPGFSNTPCPTEHSSGAI